MIGLTNVLRCVGKLLQHLCDLRPKRLALGLIPFFVRATRTPALTNASQSVSSFRCALGHWQDRTPLLDAQQAAIRLTVASTRQMIEHGTGKARVRQQRVRRA